MTDEQNTQQAEVEGQIRSYSDENLKQAITQLEDALAALTKLKANAESAPEVEGQKMHYNSDE